MYETKWKALSKVEITLSFIEMYSSKKIPVAIPYSEGGNLTEPYIKSTDEYVKPTDVTYIVESECIRIEGHPFKKLDSHTVFVNPSRYNVVQLQLPDMNKLYLPPYQGNISLNTEVEVWQLVGVRVDVQGPLTPATTGQRWSAAKPSDSGDANPTESGGATFITNGGRFSDLESDPGTETDVTQTYTWGMEHKQVQILAVGCEPLLGYHESKYYLILSTIKNF